MKITCRICKLYQGEFFTLDSMVHIYGQIEYKLLDMYNKCLHLNAASQDGLPQVVCVACFGKLKEFLEFQLKAEKSDLELREYLAKTNSMGEKTEFLINCNVLEMDELDNEKIIKTEMGNIATEDECKDFEENYEINDEEDVEDTDILFEFYSKNDSCVAKYLKQENIQKENDPRGNNVIEITANTKSSNEFNTILESIIPSIEISRIELPTVEEKTITLEPLIESRKWQCTDCGRKYLTEEKLEKHTKLHKQSENRQCEICGTKVQSLYDYSLHMKSHDTERKFFCEFCDKYFSTRANLKAHLYIHSNLRPFKCEICGKAFQQKSILKTHMTLHTGKPFECNLCNRRFSRTAHLNIHMRQHNNVRPYQCSQCPSSYMQKSHLDRHISSSHLGVRFQCTVCDKMYTKKPSLNAHMREAHCVTVCLYSCKICDLGFPKQKGLYYHSKSKHPDYKNNEDKLSIKWRK